MLAVPVSALPGHGGIYTAKYIDGANVILLNVNVAELQSGTPVSYSVRLYDMTGQPILFEAADVTLDRDEKRVYSQQLPISPDQDIEFKYTIPVQGTYELVINFLDNNKQISRAEFPLVAAKGPNQNFFVTAFTLQTAVAAILGAGLASAYWRRRDVLTFVRRFAKKKRG